MSRRTIEDSCWQFMKMAWTQTSSSSFSPSIWKDYSAHPDGLDQNAKKAFEKAFVITFDMVDKKSLHEFKLEVPKATADWPFFYVNEPDAYVKIFIVEYCIGFQPF